MKLKQVIAFNDFYGTIAQEQMSITLAYKLNKIIELTSKDVEFYTGELQKIFEDCVEKENGKYKISEDGKNLILKKGKIEEFNKRFVELCEVEVPVGDEYKIDVTLLEGIQISPSQLSQIQVFLK